MVIAVDDFAHVRCVQSSVREIGRVIRLYSRHEFVLQMSGNQDMIGRNAELPGILFLSGEYSSPLHASEIYEGNLPPEYSFCRQADVGVIREHSW